MKDLIARLREPWRMPEKKPPVMDEAADALEAQAKEIEALKSIAYSDDGAGGEGMRLYLEHHAMKAEIKALRADAERYRWLREQHWSTSAMAVITNPIDNARLGAFCPSEKLLDDAIDAARRK